MSFRGLRDGGLEGDERKGGDRVLFLLRLDSFPDMHDTQQHDTHNTHDTLDVDKPSLARLCAVRVSAAKVNIRQRGITIIIKIDSFFLSLEPLNSFIRKWNAISNKRTSLVSVTADFWPFLLSVLAVDEHLWFHSPICVLYLRFVRPL